MSDTTIPSNALFGGAVTIDDGRVQLHDPAALQSAHLDGLVHQAVFGNERDQRNARWLLWELGQIVGVRPASIHELYIARGAGKCGSSSRSPVPRSPTPRSVPTSMCR
jgi:hypothetical protein